MPCAYRPRRPFSRLPFPGVKRCPAQSPLLLLSAPRSVRFCVYAWRAGMKHRRQQLGPAGSVWALFVFAFDVRLAAGGFASAPCASRSSRRLHSRRLCRRARRDAGLAAEQLSVEF